MDLFTVALARISRLPFSRRISDPILSLLFSRWVWWCAEPPWNTRFVFQKTLTPLNGVFNWTMTYRIDSDIYAPYSVIPDPINK